MKFFYLGSLITLIFFSCEANPISEYEQYKMGYLEMTPGNTYDLTQGDLFFIEVENSTIPYLWEYDIDSNVQLLDEKTFDLNDPDIVGGSVNHIYRFQYVGNGFSMINFALVQIVEPFEVLETRDYFIE